MHQQAGKGQQRQQQEPAYAKADECNQPNNP